jgi:glutamine---fructose-6-phosphate transaminase (isomerizing)
MTASPNLTHMLQEAREAPAVVAQQWAAHAQAIAALASDLRATPPESLLTVARGSSDHAAHYMAYLIMARLGRLVTSLPMSLVTLYQSKIDCRGLTAIGFSQSGQSPDLVAPMQYFSQGGARTVALVNVTPSPLANACRHVIPLEAGTETSVAATKSFIAQLAAGAHIVAAWQDDPEFLAALRLLPEALTQAAQANWEHAIEPLIDCERLFVIGRGTGLAVAMEAALKFKETCSIQAEAFSGAEVKHGPMALIGEGYPLLIFAPRGPAQAGLLALASEMRDRKAMVLLAAPLGTPGADLPLIETGAPDLDPISTIQSFYPMVEALSRARGYHPDTPRFLAKVTRTH